MSSTTRESVGSRPDILDLEKDESRPSEPPKDAEKADVPAPNTLAASDWNGPDDPENPHNWGSLTRHYHIVPAALISFAA